LILAKNLVGNNSGKDFMKVKTLTDFENSKKEIRNSIPSTC
jgi:hypothetical protein